MIQTFVASTFVFLVLNQSNGELRFYPSVGPSQDETVRGRLDAYDTELCRSSTLATVTIWGGGAGVQIRIRERGRIDVLEYRKLKGFEYREKRDISAVQCDELFRSVRELIYAFPDDSYIPTDNPNRTFFTISYHKGGVTEEVTVEGIDPLDRALVETTQLMLQTLKNASEFSKNYPRLGLDNLTRVYTKQKARPDDHPAEVYSRNIVPEKYHCIDRDANGQPKDGIELTSICFERSVGNDKKRYNFLTLGLFVEAENVFHRRKTVDQNGTVLVSRIEKIARQKATVGTINLDDPVPALSIDPVSVLSSEIEMPRKEFRQVHSTLTQIISQCIQQPLLKSKAPEQETFILMTRFGSRTTRAEFSGIDKNDAELVKLFEKLAIESKYIKPNTYSAEKIFTFPIPLK